MQFKANKDEENRNFMAFTGSFLILFLKIFIDP